jgi:hypothetical protein
MKGVSSMNYFYGWFDAEKIQALRFSSLAGAPGVKLQNSGKSRR